MSVGRNAQAASLGRLCTLHLILIKKWGRARVRVSALMELVEFTLYIALTLAVVSIAAGVWALLRWR
jgi:hypothetical protein